VWRGGEGVGGGACGTRAVVRERGRGGRQRSVACAAACGAWLRGVRSHPAHAPIRLTPPPPIPVPHSLGLSIAKARVSGPIPGPLVPRQARPPPNPPARHWKPLSVPIPARPGPARATPGPQPPWTIRAGRRGAGCRGRRRRADARSTGRPATRTTSPAPPRTAAAAPARRRRCSRSCPSQGARGGGPAARGAGRLLGGAGRLLEFAAGTGGAGAARPPAHPPRCKPARSSVARDAAA
jgi:hypothetical protein